MTVVGYSALFQLVVPEVTVIIAALGVLAVDLLFMRGMETRARFTIGAVISCIGCVGAVIWMLIAPQQANVFDGTLVVSPQTQLVQIALLVLTIFVILISIESIFTAHVGEYLALILFATTGMMFLVSSQNILLIFISLELLSLSLYILAAFNKRSAQSAEAALKYFLFGGASAAFTLFGLSLVYGLSGSTNLTRIAEATRGSSLDPLLAVAIVMTVIGFGFKVAAVPFHFWAPDVYEGAPTSSAALIASSSKVAGLVIFYQVMVIGFAGAEGSGAWGSHVPGWVPVIAFVAALSIVLGNLVAIMQTSVRRLLAYSAIAHVGYMLLALVSHTEQSFGALLYYALTYALTTILHVDFSAFPCRNSTVGRVLRKVLSVYLNAGPRTKTAWPTLAGDSGDSDERRVPLLLPAGAQANLYCRSARRSRPNENPDYQPGRYMPDRV